MPPDLALLLTLISSNCPCLEHIFMVPHCKKLENVFVKRYAPNHMPDPKGEWCLKENNSQLHYGICLKVNQFICTLVCNYMPNIRILAKAVLQIFCSQSCSYIKCLGLKKGSNSTKNLWNRFKRQSVYLHLGLYLYAKYQDPSQSGSSEILFTRFLYTKCLCPKKGSNSTENLRNRFKS